MHLPASTAVRGLSARIAEQAVAGAVRQLCRGGTWEGLARELAWRAVTVGGCDLDSLERLCGVAEARLGSLVEEAVWAAEECAIRGWRDYLQACPGADQDALAAATLDASEQATRLIADAYAAVLESLVVEGSVSRPDRLRFRARLRKQPAPAELAA
jgi:hypothetical protein